MPTIVFSRSSASTVWASASGCVASHTYKIQVYGNGSWWDKVTGLSGSTSYTKSFSVDSANSYSARLWDVTISGSTATGTIPEWETENDVTVDIYNYLNGKNTLTDGSYTGQKGSSFSIQTAGTQYQSYVQIYTFQYFTLSSESYDTNHSARDPIKITTGLRVRVYWRTDTYPYSTFVYVDGSSVKQYGIVDNSDSRVRVSDMQGYADYSSSYDFQYATKNGGTTEYAYYSQIPLETGSTTVIRLYFKTKPKAVKPTISSISTTNTTATVYWSKNGGSYGSWYLYYGTSTTNMQSAGQITSSPKTITGLSAGTAYVFYIQNTVSSSDTARSDYASATTKSNIGYFAWTSDDSSKIRAGQPVTNLTASAWSNLISKVGACGGSSNSIYSAFSGSRVTANHFNTARNAISGLSGAGSTPSSVTAGSSKVLASLFISLKEALNRAISYKNST